MIPDIQQLWIEAERVSETLEETLHQEQVVLGLYADGVLPRSGTKLYPEHLRFARMLMLLTDEGATFTKRKELIGANCYRYTREAIYLGYLTYKKDQNGKTVVYPSELLTSLISVSKPTEAELVQC